METKDREEFFKIMLVVANHYHREVEQGDLVFDFELLKDLPLNDIRDALKEHCKQSTYFPVVADIRRIIKSKKSQPKKFRALPRPEINLERLDKLLKPLYEKIKTKET